MGSIPIVTTHFVSSRLPGSIAQLDSQQQALNLKVLGSNPNGPTMKLNLSKDTAECVICKCSNKSFKEDKIAWEAGHRVQDFPIPNPFRDETWKTIPICTFCFELLYKAMKEL